MDADQLQPVLLDSSQRQLKIAVPDPVLAVFTAGIGLLAVTVTKPGLTRSQTLWPGDTSPS